MRDPKVQGFVLEENGERRGLYMLMRNDPEPQLLDPLGSAEKLEKLEREFYEPVGKKLTMEMENTGSVD